MFSCGPYGLARLPDMVPWSEIITGAVGVAGIGGALLNGRWQAAAVNRSIAAQDERAKVAERRRIYAAAYTALCDGLLAMPGQSPRTTTAARRP